ncbi:28S ribosomal protein S18c, mitochondrial [Nasonia vitripennis]|uniref:28S ribosomal protein S18c, mitochondrial n=1 Tax=Nasonia vitripennis TaxID=7425 RepID=A0A7M7G493_NASVI|nr:28S ribosomal protein S18c, mitochondrial [Nasonia vitripennis]
MKILTYSRVLSDQAFSLLRNLSNSGRVSVYASQQRAQHSSAEEADAPIELENPYQRERKICILCKHNIDPDYKNVRFLSQFQSRFTGRIYGRHITGLCKYKQERVENEITKAQHAGLMPFYNKEITYVNDPKIFDVNNPFRPHKY